MLGEDEGTGVGVGVGAIALEDRWDLRPFTLGLIPDNKSTISPMQKQKNILFRYSGIFDES